MWDVITKISVQRKKSAVMITTHSMEEAEALCTKMGIMVKGRFKCFGSSQHIKDKYGTGYEMEIKIRHLTEADIKEVLKHMKLENKLELTHGECYKILEEVGHQDLESEISPAGIGMEFHKAFVQGQTVNAAEFVRW
jgi:ATP-binding cassette subfamily A (ABC1) protein 3